MRTTASLAQNSRQGFEPQKPACTGLDGELSRNPHWGCGHVYDETTVGLAVYVRNDPVNQIDPDGRFSFSLGIGISSIAQTFSSGFYIFREVIAPKMSGFEVYIATHSNFIDDLLMIHRAIVASYMVAPPTPGSGGGGNAGGAPKINSNKGVFWNRPRFITAVTTGMRNSIVSSALTGLNKRILDEDCSSFIGKMIGSLGGLLKGGIASASSLVSQGLNAATLHLYGAKYSPALRQGGSAFAETNNSSIYLGELFFDPASYAKSDFPAAYQVSTLIHEMFHLSTISSTGHNLKESELNSAAGGDFKSAVISNCGLK